MNRSNSAYKDLKRLQDLQESYEAAVQRTRSAETANSAAEATVQRLSARADDLGNLLATHEQRLGDTLLNYRKTTDDLATIRRAREEAERREAALRGEQTRLQSLVEGCESDVGTAAKGLGEAKNEREAALASLKATVGRRVKAKDAEAGMYRAWQAAAAAMGHDKASKEPEHEDEIAESIRKLGALKEPDSSSQSADADAQRRRNVKAVDGCGEGQESARDARLLWTPVRALERFQTVSDEFEAMRFSDEQVLTVGNVPWPTLLFPDDIRLESIEWATVEAFFRSVKTLVTGGEYKAIVEKAHRRFHPDKWMARGLLRTIRDEKVRARVEAAGNMVAQVVTPLWTASRTEG